MGSGALPDDRFDIPRITDGRWWSLARAGTLRNAASAVQTDATVRLARRSGNTISAAANGSAATTSRMSRSPGADERRDDLPSQATSRDPTAHAAAAIGSRI